MTSAVRNNSAVSCMFLSCVYLPISQLKTTTAAASLEKIISHLTVNQSDCGLRPAGGDFVNESIEGCGPAPATSGMMRCAAAVAASKSSILTTHPPPLTLTD